MYEVTIRDTIFPFRNELFCKFHTREIATNKQAFQSRDHDRNGYSHLQEHEPYFQFREISRRKRALENQDKRSGMGNRCPKPLGRIPVNPVMVRGVTCLL